MDSKNRLGHIIHSLVEFRKLWLLPAIAGVVLATVYAFFIQGETWTSRQTMIIRDDLLGDNFKPGQFLSEEAMKSAQETVLETARRPEVIRTTLEKLGPDRKSMMGKGGKSSDWPSRKLVEDYRGAVSFESANGGEFGKSEVIVLAAKSSSPERSVKFLSILTDEIDSKLAEIRASRFESMESELAATCESAQLTRSELEEKIKKMDASFGTDISLAQSMNGSLGGQPSAFDNKLNEIRSGRRNAISEVSALRSFKTWLVDARNSSSLELPTSRELLASQPELAELVGGLAKAKAELAKAEGKYNSHPVLDEGRETVASMKRQIKQLIPATIRGLDAQITVLEDRIGLLDEMMAENAELLKDISSKRVPYAALERELEKQTENYSDASARLAQVKSRKVASSSIQLLTRLGEPWVGTRADGLGKRSLSLVGGIAGLIMGLGLVMIAAPPFVEPNEPLAANARPQQQATQDHSAEEAELSRLVDLVPSRREPDETAELPREFQAVEPVPAPVPAVAVEAPQPPVAAPQIPEPVVEAPVETPFVETPFVETPVVETPFVETPVVETPVVETPVVQTPPTLVEAPVSIQTIPEISEVPTAPTQSPVPLAQSAVPSAESVVTGAAAAAGIAVVSAKELEAAMASVMSGKPPVLSDPQSPTVVLPTPPQPVSKTLAAIFSSMPQPRFDATTSLPSSENSNTDIEVASDETSQMIDKKIDTLTDELKNSLATSESGEMSDRDTTETIQLDSRRVHVQQPLPLQRRAVVRPVDLARVDENSDDSTELLRDSIDSAFSQLESTQTAAPEPPATSQADTENVFREED